MTAPIHRIFGRPMDGEIPKGFDQAIFGMGCYWGVERLFWQLDGVWLTEVGFAGGTVENPTYKQVCSGTTGHAEVVRVVYDSSRISYERLLQVFWENHDPTQGNRQGNRRQRNNRGGKNVFRKTQSANFFRRLLPPDRARRKHHRVNRSEVIVLRFQINHQRKQEEIGDTEKSKSAFVLLICASAGK